MPGNVGSQELTLFTYFYIIKPFVHLMYLLCCLRRVVSRHYPLNFL